MDPAIAVHGGAGRWDPSSPRLRDAIGSCARAARAAQELLLAGGAALDAVERAVRLLEDAPELNAGVGSYLTTAGEVEMDALIMDGQTLALGVVAAVTRVRNPVVLARRVMTASRHTLLTGAGAEAFADAAGVPRCETTDLVTPEQLEAYRAGKRAGATTDTVGAVALDSDGHLAVATSTGGIPRKMPGRVGDTPLAGAGAYADDRSAAACATGHGEALMKIVISKLVCDLAATGATAQAACDRALGTLRERLDATGGLIAIDARGGIGVARTTAGMPFARASGDGPVETGS